MRVLIVGCGYVGLPLGAELKREGHEVFGLRRSKVAETELCAAGIQPLIADVTRPDELARLPGPFDWVVNTVAPGRGGGIEDYRRVYYQGTQNLIDWLSTFPPRKFVYTSSTGVYGQEDGSLVDESSPTEPEAPTARVLVETERLLLEAARQRHFPAVILRAAGIYGPRRGYLLKQYLNNEAKILGTGERIINMIHRDDLLGIIIAALEIGRPGEIYNAVDDQPVTGLEFYRWFSEKLDKPMPPFAADIDATGRNRGLTSKRVSNGKLKQELGYRLRFPTFREGYAAEIERSKTGGEEHR